MPMRNEIARVDSTRDDTRRTYDRIAPYYDLLEGYWERVPRRVGLEILEVHKGDSVLEIGFGTGHGLVGLARAVGEAGRVFGIDLSPKMVEIAKKRLAREALSDRVELRQGDAGDLPHPDDSLDAVFMSFVLELFDTPDIPKVLAEVRRVLCPGGRVAIVSLTKAGPPTLMRRAYEWGHDHFPHVLDCRPIYVDKSLEEAGFEILEDRRLSLWGLPVQVVLARK